MMATLKQLKTQVENANALGVENLTVQGVEISSEATTHDIMLKIAEIVSGGGTEYESITLENEDFQDGDTITLIGKDGNTHIIKCVYTDVDTGGKITSISYDGKEVELIYSLDELIKVGNTDILTEVEDYTLQVNSIYEKMWNDVAKAAFPNYSYESWKSSWAGFIVIYNIENSTVDCMALRGEKGANIGEFNNQFKYYTTEPRAIITNIPVNGTELKTILNTLITTTEKFSWSTSGVWYDGRLKMYINASKDQISNLERKPDSIEIIEF